MLCPEGSIVYLTEEVVNARAVVFGQKKFPVAKQARAKPLIQYVKALLGSYQPINLVQYESKSFAIVEYLVIGFIKQLRKRIISQGPHVLK